MTITVFSILMIILKFEKNIETTEIGFFDKNNLPSDLAVEKCTREQILMCFDSYENPNAATLFD